MKLFLPQTILETWAQSEKADITDGRLVVKGEAGAHPLTPAVHFEKLVSGADQNELVGRVKTMGQLDDLGAEHTMDSVLLGDTAYQVVPGYIADVAVTQKSETKKKSSSPEADLLAAFILDKL